MEFRRVDGTDYLAPADSWIHRNPALDMHILELRLGERTTNTLEDFGLWNVEGLCSCTEDELLEVPNVGEVTIAALKQALEPYGLRLGMPLEFFRANRAGMDGRGRSLRRVC